MSPWIISPAAARDLDGIIEYIAIEQQEPEAARKLTDDFISAFDMLADAPQAGRVRPDLSGDQVRWWVLHRYLIVYQPTEQVRILRVIHGSQEIEALFRS
jgi:plasmid stabilization system protein ParE